MKNKFITTAKISILSLVLGLGVSLAYAWSGPAGAPPYCPSGYAGCDAPLNVGASTQTKSGVLWAGGLASSGGISAATTMTVGTSIDWPLTLGERMRLYNSNYSIGIQPWSMFFRADSDYYFYKMGSFSATRGDPGSGGLVLLKLNGADNKAYVNDVCLMSGSTCLSTVSSGNLSGSVSVSSSVISASGVSPTFTGTVSGAAVGDAVVIGYPSTYTCGPGVARVTSTGSVSVYFTNIYSSTTCTIPAGTYTLKVVR